MSKTFAARMLTGLFLGIVVTVLVSLGHCATTSNRKNSLGTVSYDHNPLMYLAGSLTQTSDAVSNIDGNLNLRINPLGTYMLYDESVLFCGLPVDKFQGVSEPFVMTYERQAHRTVQGIGCHNLLLVNHVVIEQRLK
jgi:hypothetical protein